MLENKVKFKGLTAEHITRIISRNFEQVSITTVQDINRIMNFEFFPCTRKKNPAFFTSNLKRENAIEKSIDDNQGKNIADNDLNKKIDDLYWIVSLLCDDLGVDIEDLAKRADNKK